MNTSHGLGRSLIRRMRAASSSPSERGTRLATLCDRIEAYAPSPPRALRSRCVVHTSSGSVGTHGGTTGPPPHDSAERPDVRYEVSALDGTLEHVGYITLADARLWGEWGWTE